MKKPRTYCIVYRGNFDLQIIKDIVIRTPYRFMALGISRSEIKSGSKCTGKTPDCFFWKKFCQCKKNHWLQCVREIDLKEPWTFCIFGGFHFRSLCFTSAAFVPLRQPPLLSQSLQLSLGYHYTTFALPPQLSQPLQPSVLSLPSQLRFATAVFTAFTSLPLPSQLLLRFRSLRYFHGLCNLWCLLLFGLGKNKGSIGCEGTEGCDGSEGSGSVAKRTKAAKVVKAAEA